MDGSQKHMNSNMNEASNGDGQRGLYGQLESFRQADAARDELLRRLIDEYRSLEVRYQGKCDDLEAEQESRRLLQANLRDTKRELNFLKGQTERDPFALALIDGDGLIFQQAFLSAGADGGAEAAHGLSQAIRDHLQSHYENDSHSISIMVHVVANFEGLSRKLASIGILRSPADLHTFARAFSCNQPLFSFVDVGMGKERADHKIKEMFRIFLHNMQCRHIIFGGCHDNGYIPNLEPFKRDVEIARRITLLEATPAQPGYRSLGYEMTSFPAVFRNDPLPESRIMPERTIPERHMSSSSMEFRPQASSFMPNPSPGRPAIPENVFSSPSPATNLSAFHAPTSNDTSPRPSSVQPKVSPGSEAAPLQTVPGRMASVPGQTCQKPSAQQPASSYATVGNSDLAAKTINIAPVKPAPRKAIFLNGDQHRIDMTLPKVDETASRAVQQRIKKQKLCNLYHLTSRCASGKDCGFSHKPDLSPAEKIALRHKARELPCYKAGHCRDVDCTSGHHCPRGGDCDSEYCKFNDKMHAVDQAVKLKEYEDGDVDVVH